MNNTQTFIKRVHDISQQKFNRKRDLCKIVYSHIRLYWSSSSSAYPFRMLVVSTPPYCPRKSPYRISPLIEFRVQYPPKLPWIWILDKYLIIKERKCNPVLHSWVFSSLLLPHYRLWLKQNDSSYHSNVLQYLYHFMVSNSIKVLVIINETCIHRAVHISA